MHTLFYGLFANVNRYLLSLTNTHALSYTRFGSAYLNLQPRITKTLLHAFADLTRPLTTHYGAIVGLSALGHYVIQLLILPNLRAYVKLLEPELNSESPIRRTEARKCYGALLVRSWTSLSKSFHIACILTPFFDSLCRKQQGHILAKLLLLFATLVWFKRTS